MDVCNGFKPYTAMDITQACCNSYSHPIFPDIPVEEATAKTCDLLGRADLTDDIQHNNTILIGNNLKLIKNLSAAVTALADTVNAMGDRIKELEDIVKQTYDIRSPSSIFMPGEEKSNEN